MRFRRTPDLLTEQRKQLESATGPPRPRFWRALLLDSAIGYVVLGGAFAAGAVALYFGLSQRTAEALVIVTALILFLCTDRARLRLRRRIEGPSPPPSHDAARLRRTASRQDLPPRDHTVRLARTTARPAFVARPNALTHKGRREAHQP
jgi:hypothetical protein